MIQNNPLCDFRGLPRFSEFQVENIKPAIDYLLNQAEKVIEEVSMRQESTWENAVDPVMMNMDRLRRAWGQVGHLNSVVSSAPLRSVFNELLPKVTEFYSRLSQNKKIYQCFKDVYAAGQNQFLSQERKRYLQNELRDYRLSGVDLLEHEQNRYQELSKKLALLSAKFSDNVLDATDDYVLNVEEYKRLEGLPDAILFEAKARATSLDQPGWSFTLKAPCWIPFMESCTDRNLREQMYHAYVTRASEYGKKAFDNSRIIVDILSARHEKAKLLGLDSFAHLSFATKMAAEPQRALDLMAELSDMARDRAVSEFEMLSDYALSRLGMRDLMPWDISFVAQKIKEERYSFKDEDLRQYFPLRKVMLGLFDLLGSLYGISVLVEKKKAWDPNVQLFAVNDQAGNLIGYFYMDLFARDGKRPGAWMDDAIGRWKTE
ncbi:MAG: M3 family metallopeptidase, partial [Proteobacteria bacterium]|nr:M3 family metallopeptidase [Pseudomonadota bacterium]